MPTIPRSLRRKVTLAAHSRCGYCLTTQQVSGAQMHIDHIVPLSHGGTSDESNLWLACALCNSYKGMQTHALDPLTGARSPLFNPRTDIWSEHFHWSNSSVEIIGITAVGRATVVALRLNNELIAAARRQWVLAGWHPPQD